MDERLLLIGGALAIAVGLAHLARGRERRRAASAPLNLAGIDGRVVFFSDAVCARCDIVRVHLEALGADFTEIAYDEHPDLHRQVGVTGVPLVVIRDEAGAEVRRFAGVAPKARLAAALP